MSTNTYTINIPLWQFLSKPTYASPANTLVGSASGLQINLVWDASVKAAANWQAIENSITTAASSLVGALTTAKHTVINIAVGFGEVGGHSLSSNALGESSSVNYVTSYSTLTNSLKSINNGVSDSLNPAVSGAQYLIGSAQAKALGLLNPTSSNIDGYIGITNNTKYLSFSGTPSATQYDVVGIAAHEISEVMGRMRVNGTMTNGGKALYSTLDLLTTNNTFTATINGHTLSNTFNRNSSGDSGDWASSSASSDVFNAFSSPGTVGVISPLDLVELAALGYVPTSSMLDAVNNGIGIIA